MRGKKSKVASGSRRGSSVEHKNLIKDTEKEIYIIARKLNSFGIQLAKKMSWIIKM